MDFKNFDVRFSVVLIRVLYIAVGGLLYGSIDGFLSWIAFAAAVADLPIRLMFKLSSNFTTTYIAGLYLFGATVLVGPKIYSLIDRVYETHSWPIDTWGEFWVLLLPVICGIVMVLIGLELLNAKFKIGEGRASCTSCSYSLVGLPTSEDHTVRCPECGTKN
ncbi:MAG: hypothetical protein KDD64_14495 [Bdellovibrionales bacterium]|nr:hypothetical protein [Bdellovibrionales bacterium]